jgi:hypothetical protein
MREFFSADVQAHTAGETHHHRFALGEVMKADDIFGNAAQGRALKVILTR